MAQMIGVGSLGRLELSDGMTAMVRLLSWTQPSPVMRVVEGLPDFHKPNPEVLLEVVEEPSVAPIERQMALSVLAGDRASAMALADRLLASLHADARG